jgi:hypothetical protein
MTDEITSLEHSCSWEADSPSPDQEICRLSRNPKVHYRLHKNSTLDPIHTHMNPLHILAQIINKKINILWNHCFNSFMYDIIIVILFSACSQRKVAKITY